jgi:hypothetical protein
MLRRSGLPAWSATGTAFSKEKTSEGSKVIQNPATLLHVKFKLLQGVQGHLHRLQTARERRVGFPLHIRFNVEPRLRNRLM